MTFITDNVEFDSHIQITVIAVYFFVEDFNVLCIVKIQKHSLLL